MNILISANTYEGYGLGNIYRSIFLYENLNELINVNIYFESNQNISHKIAKQYKIAINKSKEKYIYDTVIYDSPYNFLYNKTLPEEEIKRMKRLKTVSKKIIALDYCRFQENWPNIVINLYNHNKKSISKYNGKIYSGLDYTILKPEIINSKFKCYKNDILITIGGEDINSDTIKFIEKYPDLLNSTSFIVGANNPLKNNIKKFINNKGRYLENISNMGEEISNHRIIICNGGTTLLEAIYLKKNIIPIAQNEFEKKFISKIKYPFYSLNEIPNILKNEKIELPTIIDNKGLNRIKDIVLSHTK